ncbi:LEAF RUST 10 DISEASE-RESISTANCE LOCUS RECEPTOR-LIKE PROTEIN KINASE-like 1.2 isoform X4 [Magnolia sinica]|uniref:LEAF RUST 10 DISEASE-RESISTANCE LOCUS RECEPTOR-LIKE PROTEIN KINASE-like 1.2 isoform X4 n=1 Tax=Magnolia sinica TaxID=86752 RepID=UPI002659F21F|nr:LEAF RUST 10 DISEASE-RESISTANCE LOCUS RECEPTOR-LIKE PROTEIN KINASE-like 1.2 isoform X4 [Magnolia sinica]
MGSIRILPRSSSILFSSSFILLIFLIPSFLSDDDERFSRCAPFTCGNIPIHYPFWVDVQSEYCGYPGYNLSCHDNTTEMEMMWKQYLVKDINYDDQMLRIVDKDFMDEECPQPSTNTTINSTLFGYSSGDLNLILYYNCPSSIPTSDFPLYSLPCLTKNNNYAFFTFQPFPPPNDLLRNCHTSNISLIETARPRLEVNPHIFGEVLKEGFEVKWTTASGWCGDCMETRGRCGFNATTLQHICLCPDQPRIGNCSGLPVPIIHPGRNGGMDKKKIIVITIGAGALVLFLALLVFLLFRRIRNKNRPSISSNLLSRSISSDPYSKSELEKGIQTQFFEYKELEEATNNFDPSKELGDGGFGTVYHGKLRDGRFVAVKRLYENNYKRVEQFKNEIDILSRLRHRNLVTLYGCSSRHRRELLLVYEFIPNGTVADHLHGDRVQAGTLTWSIRMSIAVETADALAYLHKVEIIHRDVKTNNILLDNNFCVKVADFGLSRLFPLDVTHVSTAPQGTPGYVDPDYHRCYQLTDRSDVYSFGVVLIELISSMPAVDISRHRHEINLASMAITKIHNNALHELVDSTLGFDSDFSVRRMITSVAQLAFRCLQEEKEVRPSMEEVLEELRGIESEEYKVEKIEEVGIPVDETALLKNNLPPSPDTVTKAWDSRTTTPNTSG